MTEWSVPGYVTLRSLGSGGSGEVMLARHEASGALAAIKYLHGELLRDREFVRLFRGEAAVLAALDDVNVVRLYEHVESPSGAAIVMELIQGVSLRQILASQGRTTAEAALVVLQGSLLGLAAAHQRGVVHRTCRPENVLVNGDGISKLTDCGVAARADDHKFPAATLRYAAPEQIAGAPVTPAGDVYAATVTFYECLTGGPPYTGDSTGLLRQHRVAPVPLTPVPEPLRPLIAAGMAKNPRYRPADALSLVAQLRTAAAGAYGDDWAERGHAHLGEAALALAALWPAGAPPVVEGTAARRFSLFRHMSVSKAALGAAIAVGVVAAAGTALALSGSHPSGAPHRPVAIVHSVPLRPSSSAPSSTAPSSSAPSPSPSATPTGSASAVPPMSPMSAMSPTPTTPASIPPASSGPAPAPSASKPSPAPSPTRSSPTPSPSPSSSSPSPSPAQPSPSPSSSSPLPA